MSNRNIIDVINQIKPILIENGQDVTTLDEIISSKEFAAPELDHLHWRALQTFLVHIAMNHTSEGYDQLPDWLKRVSDIITNKAGA